MKRFTMMKNVRSSRLNLPIVPTNVTIGSFSEDYLDVKVIHRRINYLDFLCLQVKSAPKLLRKGGPQPGIST